MRLRYKFEGYSMGLHSAAKALAFNYESEAYKYHTNIKQSFWVQMREKKWVVKRHEAHLLASLYTKQSRITDIHPKELWITDNSSQGIMD